MWNSILDFIFPPTQSELELRALTTENLFVHVPKAPQAPYPFVTSLFAYKHPLVSSLVLSIKNKRNAHALSLAAYALHERLPRATLLVPIPLSKERRKERGFNQCEVLIDEILKCDKKNGFEKNFDLLIRTKNTSQQKLKNRRERFEGTESIFEIDQEMPDKTIPIVIIDDVTTTGSTLKEARETLMKAGYTQVTAFTIAH